MNNKEHYDPNLPVCGNQDDFNQAFREAVKYNNDQNMKKAKPWIYVYMVILLIFLVWALMLAMQMRSGENRVLNLVFAILFSPIYVICHYINSMGGVKASVGNV